MSLLATGAYISVSFDGAQEFRQKRNSNLYFRVQSPVAYR